MAIATGPQRGEPRHIPKPRPRDRDNVTNSNTGHGINTATGSNVSENSARSNTLMGLSAGALSTGYRNNVFGNNNGGDANPQVSSGTDLGGNLCGITAGCP